MFITNHSTGSICDRLKQKYGNNQSLFKIQGKNTGDVEFIQYIVNFIIEQAKYNIVISELPDVIRTLHCEAEVILRKNRMITLEEMIAQVQIAGAMKYPYLKKMKPISTEDFVREVMRKVFDRLGTIITLDKIENICRFTTCSAKQLLQAMPAIDVNEAATLIIEDISRNQNQKQTNSLKEARSLSSLSIKAMHRKLGSTPISTSKQRMRSERQLSRLRQNSKPSFSKTKLIEHKDSAISHRSSKNINRNQIDSTEKRLLKLKESNSHSTKECSQIETSVQKQTKNLKEEVGNPLTDLFPILNNDLIDQKIQISRSRSNTQTYSIHSEEGLSTQTRKPTTPSASKMNNTIIEPIRVQNKISEKSIKRIPSHTAPFTNIVPLSIEVMHSSNLKETRSHSKKLQAIRHYTKYCHQRSYISDNEEQITETDTEKCPLEDILNHRLLQQI